MQRIFNARTELEAHEVRLFLESHGIHAAVVGESSAFTSFSFSPSSEPGVVVDAADAHHAAKLLQEQRASRPTAVSDCDWKCSRCGEVCGPSFNACWNCNRPRSGDELAVAAEATEDAPIVDTTALPLEGGKVDVPAEIPSALPSDLRALVEVAILLTITLPWPLSNRLYEHLDGTANASTFVGQALSTFVMELLWIAFAMAIIFSSGENWSRFGFRPLQPIDALFSTGMLFVVTAFAISVSNGMFHDFARGWLSHAKYHSLFEQPTDWIRLRGSGDALFALGLALSIGFAEELVFRGILLPRFEQLLRSTYLSVIVTSILFSSIHWHQGPASVWNALAVGLIFGAVFAYFRNLWPLIFCHALIDFVVFLRSGTMVV